MQKLGILVIGASAFALASTAANADGYQPVAIKAVAPCCDGWTGFYIGTHGGYGWKKNDFSEFLGTIGGTQFFVGGIDSEGWLLGGQAGYNWQKGALVGGLELDFSASDIDGSSSTVLPLGAGSTDTITRADDVRWLGSARARLGVTPGGCCSNFLLYGTGGLAWERFDRTATSARVSATLTQTIVSTTPDDRFGWVLGVGGEAKLGGSGWLGRIEYLHYEFGTSETTTTVTSTIPTNNSAESDDNQTIEVIRTGLSYKF